MSLTQSQQSAQNLNLQKSYILSTGSMANAAQLAAFNAMIETSGNFSQIDKAIDNHINFLIAQQGVVATLQAIAKNGYGLILSNSQAQTYVTELTAVGIDSGSKLINYLNTLQWEHSATLENRGSAASDFIDTLNSAGKAGLFNSPAMTTASYQLLQNIDGSATSLANAKTGFNSLSDKLSATGITGTLEAYLSGATVYADVNGNGMLDAGEWSSSSSSNGTFEVPASLASTKVIAFGGTDLLTGNVFQGVLSSSTGSTVLNPISTMIAAMSAKAGTVHDATTAIKEAFNLPANINLLSYNALAVLASSSATAAEKAVALQVQKASQQISNVITQTASVIDTMTPNVTLQSAALAVSAALASAISAAAKSSSGDINLTSVSSVGEIIQAAASATNAPLSAAQVQQIASVTAGSNISAAVATNITLLAQAADVAQGSATTALIAGANNNNFDSAVAGFTGSSLTLANYNVTVGSIVPGVAVPATISQNAAAQDAIDADAAAAAALQAPKASLAYSVDAGATSSSTLSVKNADTLRIIATFDKAVADGTPTITISNGILTVATAMTKIDATHYRYDLDVPAGDIATATVSIGGARTATSNTISAAPGNAIFAVDNTAPTAPTALILTSVGGTVVANTLNTTNTSLSATASIKAGEATGGTAVLKIGTTSIATDSVILATDTSVSFNLNTLSNAALQQAVAASGLATVTLTDAAGNSSVSQVANPTLTVDYAAALVNLTTALDNLVGGANNDIFSGTFGNGAGPYTLNIGDTLNGAGGTDTLNITTGAEASTPPDGLWANVSNFEKVVFESIGNGAQSITTGNNFANAFAAQGVDLTAKTLLGAIDLTMTGFTGAAKITTITTGAGAHSITTGSGTADVKATAVSAGAQTINGVGLTTVDAIINGAGHQVIGTTLGGNLVTVKATILAAGDQTIASTSGNAVTIVASAANGAQTITTAGGNDKVTTTGAAGQTATISTGAGNDVIVSSATTDLITGGTGSDTMTGGGGTDTFAFGTNGSVIGTDRDSITDFNSSGADILRFGGSAIVLTADTSTLVAGANVNTSAGGLITFAAADDTLAKKILAIQADVQLDVAGSVGMFVDGGNTYVYYAGAAAGNADDQLIELIGITNLTTMTGGASLTIA